MNLRSKHAKLILAISAAGLLLLFLLFLSFWQRPASVESPALVDSLKPPILERATAGAEPVVAENLESTNLGVVGVFVRDKAGQPVPGAKVQLRINKWRDGWRTEDSTLYTTDAFGFVEVTYPVQRISSWTDIFASCDEANLGGKVVRWERSWEIPATCTITLGRTMGLGGVVVDENGSPIAGAQVKFFRFMLDGIENHRQEWGEHFGFPIQPVMTDGWGRWSRRGVPLAIIDRIGFTISHPDFIPRQHYCDLKANMMDALQVGDFRTELRQGVPVRGMVQDETGTPVTGASVQLDSAEVQTDATGRFSFRNLSGGSHLITVAAQGYLIENRPIKIVPEQDELVIQLQRGNLICGRVQDESGAVLANVHVFSEGMDYHRRSASNYAATTDATGQFHWGAAPSSLPPIRFSRPGFVTLTNVQLQTGADNVIMLRKLADLEGMVLDDATSEPVKRFRVGLRNRYTRDGYASRAQEFAGADGRFKLARDSDADEIWIGSEDYEHHTGWISSHNNVAPSVYRLRPKANGSVRGVVVSPQGNPVPGVQVARAGRTGKELTLKPGRFYPGAESTIITSDDQGEFSLWPTPAATVIYAVSSGGFGQATAGEIGAGQPLVLQTFGRLKGTLEIDGRPAPREWVQFRTRLPGMKADMFDYVTRTDEDGDFSFDRVPPGLGEALRFNEKFDFIPEDELPPAVRIKPGETATVTVRDGETAPAVK